MNTKDVQLDARYFCLFKGDPGTGKSIAAASYPNPYFFDMDGRMKSVVNYWRPRGKEFEYDQFDSFFKLNKRLEEFMVYCPFKTLCYDGITAGSKQILRDMMTTRDSGAKKIVRGGIELFQIEDYGGEARGLDIIIENLRAISIRQNINVIVTAHVLTTESTDIKTKVTTVSRSLLTAGKKVASALPIWFDECYHFDVQTDMDITQEPHYTVVTRNVGTDWAKTALPIPTRINFTNGSLYDIISDKLAEFVQPVNKEPESF